MGDYPWGGSEELWSKVAMQLARDNFKVVASVFNWSPPHPRVLELKKNGVYIQFRPNPVSTSIIAKASRALYSLTKSKTWDVLCLERLIRKFPGSLVVFSSGGNLPKVESMEFCVSRPVMFVTIGQANSESSWPADPLAARYRAACANALRCYFVSEANRKLTEKQIGCDLPNAEVVRNPFNVSRDVECPWPSLGPEDELRFACVARLHPPSKGQDIALEALAQPVWRARKWRLSFYGTGPMQETVRMLAQRLKIADRVRFMGHVNDIENVWAKNHVLLMPSRYEGLPLVMVEAMLCGRPVVATDIAGHREILHNGISGFLADCPTVASVGEALERAWANRTELQKIGKTAAHMIRELIPPDPVAVFAEKLKALLAEGAPQ
jgi:glycosyltransferase involved in cell wall biosynthesis